MRFDGVDAKLRLGPVSFQAPVSSLAIERRGWVNAARTEGDTTLKHNPQQHPLEIRMEKIARGYRGIEDKTMWLVFAEGKLLPDEVATRLQKGSNAFARVNLAEAEVIAATAERDHLIPSLRRLCADAMLVAKRHYGGDPEKMASFGVEKPASSKARPRRAKPRGAKPGHCGARPRAPLPTESAHPSQNTASRDINDLVVRGILVKAPGGGRSTHYAIAPGR